MTSSVKISLQRVSFIGSKIFSLIVLFIRLTFSVSNFYIVSIIAVKDVNVFFSFVFCFYFLYFKGDIVLIYIFDNILHNREKNIERNIAFCFAWIRTIFNFINHYLQRI